MRYEAILYFDGPKSKWLQRPDDSEVLARMESRFKVIAEGWGKKCSAGLANTKFIVVEKP